MEACAIERVMLDNNRFRNSIQDKAVNGCTSNKLRPYIVIMQKTVFFMLFESSVQGVLVWLQNSCYCGRESADVTSFR